MHYKIASLILNGGQKNNSIADIFIAQPDTAKEALAGKLFIMAEIESQKTEGAKILDFLINNINHNYYHNEKIILRERIDTILIENIFENALSKTNKDLIDFLTREKIKITPFSFNITVGVVHNNELYIASIGKNKNTLIYKDKTPVKTIKNRGNNQENSEYKISDIGKTEEEDSQVITINKLFSEVLSGKIPPGGYFISTNEAMSEYLSPKQLTEIITRLSPSGAMEQIRNLIEKVNSYASFFGILIKNTSAVGLSEEDLKKQLEDEIKNWSNKPEIVSTEEKTEAILNPAGAINIKRWGSNLAKILKDNTLGGKNKNNGAKKENKFLLKDKILFKKRVQALSLEKLFLLIKKIFEIIKKILLRKKSEEITEINEGEERKTIFINKKIAIIALVLATLLVSGTLTNIFFAKKRQEKDKILATFNSLISEIDRNQNKIESSLIYGNENEARQLWTRNEEILAQISEDDKKNREDIKQFITKQNTQLEKIRKINNIASPEKIADFGNLDKTASPDNLVLNNEKIFAASGDEKTIYQIDLKEKMITASRNIGEVTEMNNPNFSDNGIHYLDGSSLITIANDGSFKKISINQTPQEIGGMAVYGNRLYLIDRKEGQIMRYLQNDDSFSSPEKWLNEKTDLSNAQEIFIDGNIYVLKKNGSVEKYLKGQKESFSLAQIDTPINNATKMIIGQKHIYVFEPEQKRAIIFSPEGAFEGQYVFSDLEKITDFTASDEKETIYILSGQSIYQTPVK